MICHEPGRHCSRHSRYSKEQQQNPFLVNFTREEEGKGKLVGVDPNQNTYAKKVVYYKVISALGKKKRAVRVEMLEGTQF